MGKGPGAHEATGVDKEGIIPLVVECQHGWGFSVLCGVVRQNMAGKSDRQSGRSLQIKRWHDAKYRRG